MRQPTSPSHPPRSLTPRSGISTLLLWVALLLVWVGERAVAGGTSRWVVGGLGVAALLAAAGLLGVRIARAHGQHRAALMRLAVDYGLCAAALVGYVVQTDEVGLLEAGAAREVVRIVAAGLLVAGLLSASAVELSLRAIGGAPQVELWRVAAAGRAARIVFLAVVAFGGLNFAASKWNRKIDLSYFKTSAVGSANRALVESLTRPVEILLFFPPGNDVLEHVRAYVDELASHSDRVRVEVTDRALDPERARKLKVRDNGTLAIVSGPFEETLRLGLDVEGAAATLRKLDEKVHELLLKVLRPPRVAYFTTGHLERDYSPPADDKRRGMSDFKDVLGSLGFSVRRLGLGEGLGSQIPDDATLIIVAGPAEGFMPSELETLHAYLRRGGRALFLIDPDFGSTADDLLAPLGLQVTRSLAATEDLRHLWRMGDAPQSPYNLVTTSTSSHASVTTLSKSAGRHAVVLQGAGEVRKLDEVPPGLSISFTLRTMPKSFLDDDGDGRLDADTEKATTLDLGAVVTARGSRPPEEGAQAEGADQEPPEMRAIVLGDADLAGNLLIRNQGNLLLVLDAVRWLAGDEAIAGTVESEKDVRITHRKDEDRIWFYGSSVLMPAAVLAAGMFTTRRMRRGGREATQREG